MHFYAFLPLDAIYKRDLCRPAVSVSPSMRLSRYLFQLSFSSL